MDTKDRLNDAKISIFLKNRLKIDIYIPVYPIYQTYSISSDLPTLQDTNVFTESQVQPPKSPKSPISVSEIPKISNLILQNPQNFKLWSSKSSKSQTLVSKLSTPQAQTPKPRNYQLFHNPRTLSSQVQQTRTTRHRPYQFVLE